MHRTTQAISKILRRFNVEVKISLRILLTLAVIRLASGATSYVTIPATNNIQTSLINVFPNGTLVANNKLATPFSIPSAAGKCGPASDSPCNFYDGFGFSGNGKSISIDVSVSSPTDVYTLMNAYQPAAGRQLATIQFIGSAGANLTFSLIGGQNIRDFYQGGFTNVLTNGVAGVTASNAFMCTAPAMCLGAGGSGNVKNGNAGNYVIDEQDFSLGSAFLGQTLTKIIITDTNNGSNPILMGITAASSVSAAPSIATGGIVSASAFGGFTTIAPGSWIEIYGSNLATTTRSWAGTDFTGINAPTSLSGTGVSIGGQPAFIDYISPGQINAQVPSNVLSGQQPIVVSTAGGNSATYQITVKPTQPGFLAPLSFVFSGQQAIVALFPDGVTYVLPPDRIPGLSSRRAKPGDTLTLYGVGFGAVNFGITAGQIVQQSNSLLNSLQVDIGGVSAVVTYSGLAPGYVGLYQFNLIVPNVAPSDSVPVTVTLSGTAGTQTLFLAIQN